MSAKIHFYVRTNRPSKDGSLQIFMLISLSRTQRLTISTGQNIPLRKEYRNKLDKAFIQSLSSEKLEDYYFWDRSKERATKGDFSWEKINHHLDNEKTKANDIVLKYELMKKPLTLTVFKSAFSKNKGTDKFYEYFTEEFKSRKNLIANETYKGYMAVIRKINKFKPNLSLADIDYKFLVNLENHMAKPVAEGGLGNIPSTISKNMKSIRAMIWIAIKNDDYLREAYPFEDYKIKHVDPELTTRDYCEPDDIYAIESLLFPQRIKELSPGEVKATKRFLFACYTGLRFSDVNKLNSKQHIFGKWIPSPIDGHMEFKKYIELRMTKTSNPVYIPLIDKAIELINESKEDKIFETISNQKINKHLKSINTKAGINKKLSFHVARHSFATTCFLYGIPEKVGQKLLGHKNRKFTAVYTHLSQNRLFYEMDKLNRGFKTLNIPVDQADFNMIDVKELMPVLQNMNQEKLDQIKGLIKLLGKTG
ncbi:MAG: site-specific integrase [Bacteroidia bacterium]|nr:site-specific integrase [Bacteroidia bacterium]